VRDVNVKFVHTDYLSLFSRNVFLDCVQAHKIELSSWRVSPFSETRECAFLFVYTMYSCNKTGEYERTPSVNTRQDDNRSITYVHRAYSEHWLNIQCAGHKSSNNIFITQVFNEFERTV